MTTRSRPVREKAQLGIVANIAYQFAPEPSHWRSTTSTATSGRDEGRFFEGRQRRQRPLLLPAISGRSSSKKALLSNGVAGEHFFPEHRQQPDRLADQRGAARPATNRIMKESLYEVPLDLNTLQPDDDHLITLADESQSGFRMFSELDDDTVDVAANWSLFSISRRSPDAVQVRLRPTSSDSETSRRGGSATSRSCSTRTALSPINLTPGARGALHQSDNIGTVLPLQRGDPSGRRLRPAIRPRPPATAWSTSRSRPRSRLVAGARVERFEQAGRHLRPVRPVRADRHRREPQHRHLPGASTTCYSLRPDMNLRLGYSTTVNRPEFRELAAFEFTDVVGSRAVRGNPDLERALIQNVDSALGAVQQRP